MLQDQAIESARPTHGAADVVAAFESCAIDPGEFHHRDHVLLTWSYLRRFSLAETLGRLPRAIRRFAASVGAPGKYHETITLAFILLINERMARGDADGYEAFAAANVDLFEWPNPVLRRCYRKGTLESDLARRTFVFPDA